MTEPSHRGLVNTITVVSTLPASASDTRIAALIPAGLWTILSSDDRRRAFIFLSAAILTATGLAATLTRFVLTGLFVIGCLFH